MDDNKLNPDVADSLKQMKMDEAAADSVPHSIQESELPIAQPQTITLKESLRIFEEINQQMAMFCQDLNAVDAKFGDFAQIFYKEACRLAEKERRSDEEDTELLVNCVAGAAVEAAGKIWMTWKNAQELSRIKDILQYEAQGRLAVIRRIKPMLPEIIEMAYGRYESECDPVRAAKCIDNIRESEYGNSIVLFLEATYEAALSREFQSKYPYPCMAPINRHILYSILCERPKLAQHHYVAERRACIDGLIKLVLADIDHFGDPMKKCYVFASDPQLMATAIMDCNPLRKSEEVEWADEDDMIMKCEEYYGGFLDLCKAAADHPKKEIAQALINNKSLQTTFGYIADIAEARDDSNDRLGTQVFTIVLIGILAFLGSWSLYDIAWYWGLTIGFVAAILFLLVSPISAGISKAKDKLMRIEKTIQIYNQQEAGEIQVINLAEIERKNDKRWKYACIGALIGLIFFGWGAIIGGILGFVLGSDDYDETGDYSYEHINLKATVKSRILMYLLLIADLYLLYRIIF